MHPSSSLPFRDIHLLVWFLNTIRSDAVIYQWPHLCISYQSIMICANAIIEANSLTEHRMHTPYSTNRTKRTLIDPFCSHTWLAVMLSFAIMY